MTLHKDSNIELFTMQTTKKGRNECGDSYFYTRTEEYFICVLADGLGSGEHAYHSSNAVLKIVEEYHQEDVDTLMKYCNQVLFQKRGAAVLILKVYFSTQQLIYSCVGNIRFFLYSPSGKLTYPLPVTGYLSGKPQAYRTQRFTYEKSSKFLIFSDGFHIQGAKSLLQMSPSVERIANEIKVLYKNNADDATCIVGSLL